METMQKKSNKQMAIFFVAAGLILLSMLLNSDYRASYDGRSSVNTYHELFLAAGLIILTFAFKSRYRWFFLAAAVLTVIDYTMLLLTRFMFFIIDLSFNDIMKDIDWYLYAGTVLQWIAPYIRLYAGAFTFMGMLLCSARKKTGMSLSIAFIVTNVFIYFVTQLSGLIKAEEVYALAIATAVLGYYATIAILFAFSILEAFAKNPLAQSEGEIAAGKEIKEKKFINRVLLFIAGGIIAPGGLMLVVLSGFQLTADSYLIDVLWYIFRAAVGIGFIVLTFACRGRGRWFFLAAGLSELIGESINHYSYLLNESSYFFIHVNGLSLYVSAFLLAAGVWLCFFKENLPKFLPIVCAASSIFALVVANFLAPIALLRSITPQIWTAMWLMTFAAYIMLAVCCFISAVKREPKSMAESPEPDGNVQLEGVEQGGNMEKADEGIEKTQKKSKRQIALFIISAGLIFVSMLLNPENISIINGRGFSGFLDAAYTDLFLAAGLILLAVAFRSRFRWFFLAAGILVAVGSAAGCLKDYFDYLDPWRDSQYSEFITAIFKLQLVNQIFVAVLTFLGLLLCSLRSIVKRSLSIVFVAVKGMALALLSLAIFEIELPLEILVLMSIFGFYISMFALIALCIIEAFSKEQAAKDGTIMAGKDAAAPSGNNTWRKALFILSAVMILSGVLSFWIVVMYGVPRAITDFLISAGILLLTFSCKVKGRWFFLSAGLLKMVNVVPELVPVTERVLNLHSCFTWWSMCATAILLVAGVMQCFFGRNMPKALPIICSGLSIGAFVLAEAALSIDVFNLRLDWSMLFFMTYAAYSMLTVCCIFAAIRQGTKAKTELSGAGRGTLE